MSEWKELLNPHEQLEGPAREGHKTDNPENKAENVGGGPGAGVTLDKTLFGHRLHSKFYPARTRIREVI